MTAAEKFLQQCETEQDKNCSLLIYHNSFFVCGRRANNRSTIFGVAHLRVALCLVSLISSQNNRQTHTPALTWSPSAAHKHLHCFHLAPDTEEARSPSLYVPKQKHMNKLRLKQLVKSNH